MTPTRPVLRWHGGKWMLAPWIIGHFPEHRIYTEVFGGAASILLRKNRAKCEVYNDLDSEVVNLFRVLQDNAGAARLIELLRLTPWSRDEFNLSYEPSSDPVERARRLVIVCFMGFGSNAHMTDIRVGFRSNSSGSGRTPAMDWCNYPDALARVVDRFRGVVIENRPAVEVLLQHDDVQSLHYVDPPYVHSTRDGKVKQKDYRHEMTDEDHRALAAVLRDLRGGVILSGYPSPLYDGLYGDWHRVERAALADGARKRTEVLWINAAAWSHGMRLL